MLSLQNHSGILIPPSDFERDEIPSDQDPQRRNSTRSMTDTSTLPDYQFIDDSESHAASFTTENSSGSPDAWAEEGSSELTAKVYQNPFVHSSFPCTSPPASFGYCTISASRDNFLLDEVTPKIEELDDVEELDQIKLSAGKENKDSSASGVPATVPRKRGRPRKHPLPAPSSQVKVTKGRSKTGCITCRRRKKKCDETKPAYSQAPPSTVACH